MAHLNQPYVMGTLPAHPGYEARGAARAFMARIKANERAAYEATRATFNLAKKGFKGTKPKPGYLISIENSWATLPLFGSIIRDFTRTDKGLTIMELRLTTGSLHVETWEEDRREDSIVLTALYLTVNKHSCKPSMHECAAVGYHAVTRFFQRSFQPTELKAQLALAELFISHKQAMQAGGEFSIKAGDGNWVGQVCAWDRNAGGKILRVATFHD